MTTTDSDASEALRHRLAALHSALREVRATAGDRPPGEPDLLAERIEDVLTEAGARVDEALRSAATRAPLPLPRLVAVDAAIRATLRTLDAGLAGAAPRLALGAMARRRGGGWPAWLGALVPAVDAAWEATLAAGDAVHRSLAAVASAPGAPSLRLAN
jgi:hypothetical protein